MFKQACVLCKIHGVIASIGALNWGLIDLTGNNMVEQIFGAGTYLTSLVYFFFGLSGIMLILSFFVVCPKCKK